MKSDGELLTGVVEMDETYIGGKLRQSGKKDDDNNNPGAPRGRETKKTAVVGMVERGGNVKAEKGNKGNKGMFKSKDLNELIRRNVDPNGSVLITDEYRVYSKVSKILKHYTINHQLEYVNGEINTNTIESFWAIVKRGIVGKFHKVSVEYLDKYLNEFCFRFNLRKAEQDFAFNSVIQRML